MENVNNLENTGAHKKSSWRGLIMVAGILILIAGGYLVYSRYFSSEARYYRQTQKQYEAYQQFANKYQTAMGNDTYGGKTPEETLRLFTEALKKDDLELAGKYFVLREDGQTDPVWQEALQKTKDAGMLAKTIEIIPQMTYDASSSLPETAWYIFKNHKGDVQYSVSLKLNPISKIWKIESL